ncbi:PQQ-dependent sugar dehydrogenase [Hydromonas duriensis]|uniref:Glucose/arabinose dehydrogenase n=1 Tax=Hydromonas duriensis TaxID=1527608 RepID=A0A4R6Y767_9BURK|nr:PQQ-dependent sugar dehydrogenase [Hydromonas duriensis]TDR31137.1 glucose/arabinose dehydrogenase [Hydromonas duriensis]
MKKISVACAVLLSCLTASIAVAKNPYPVAGVCHGLPKVDVSTIANTCLAVVASDLKMPRGVLPLSDGDIWLTEMGSWERGRGRLSRVQKNDKGYERTTILDGLDRPHGLALGPDGWIYVAEAGRILRVNPNVTVFDKRNGYEIVMDDLLKTGLHPLKQIAFDAKGDLYISMGAQTDHCERPQASGGGVEFPCQETQGARATAAIWKVNLREGKRIEVFARGVRNAMGVTFSAKGDLVVTENGRDNISRLDKKLNDATLPHDALMVVTPKADYGWPYCYDGNRLNPEYRSYSRACIGKAKPNVLLPAHSAPLGIMRYANDGVITALRGQYLIALHGYRDTGHRLVAMPASGQLSGKTSDVVSRWGARGDQPMGAPVDLKASPSGLVYMTDDRNDALLVLSNQL